MSQGMLGFITLSEVRGPRNDLEEKLAGPDGREWLRALKRMLRKEDPWVIKSLEVTTKGRTGEELIRALEKQGFRFGDYTKELLFSQEFVATNNQTYQLTLIMGDEFKDSDRINHDIRAEAVRRGYLDPPVELAPYLREMISDEDLERMCLRDLVIMHKPIADSRGCSRVLSLSRHDRGRWLVVFGGDPGSWFGRDIGFLFLTCPPNPCGGGNSP